jgi:hypothetical protein
MVPEQASKARTPTWKKFYGETSENAEEVGDIPEITPEDLDDRWESRRRRDHYAQLAKVASPQGKKRNQTRRLRRRDIELLERHAKLRIED